MYFKRFLTSVLLAAFLSLPVAAASLPSPRSPLIAAGPAKILEGWRLFCAKNAKECSVNTDEPERFVLTEELWDLLNRINKHVNSTVKGMTDKDQFDQADVWRFPTNGIGDCEDYQLFKRKLLVESGIPRRAMRITVVIDELGEGHAVLAVLTDRGDLILDNKRNDIVHWQDTPYNYIKRESSSQKGWLLLSAPIL